MVKTSGSWRSRNEVVISHFSTDEINKYIAKIARDPAFDKQDFFH